MEEITMGVFTVPAILTVMLGVIYKVTPAIPDRWKALIAICAGIAIGIVAMFYNVEIAKIGIKVIIDYILGGGMAGAASVGLYEGVWRTATNTRG